MRVHLEPPDPRTERWAALLNLLLPGGGLILIGMIVRGFIVGCAFVLCVNFAIVTVLLMPDDFPWWVPPLALGLAGGGYVGAQLRLAQSVRDSRRRAQADRRRACLHNAQEELARGRPLAALEALAPLADQAARDLLVALRMAQALTAAGDVPAARAAWRQVRRLDRHGIYREQARDHERQLAQAGRP